MVLIVGVICYNTNKLVEKEGVLNVHIVCHSHDDVGWLKTVDQYYQGSNQTIQNANVALILDSVYDELRKDVNRKFTYVEMAFFSKWYNDQSPSKKSNIQKLVRNGQLEFINGGWCMHDEASTHYIGMIDQTTLGHDFIKENFGVEFIPRVGWQIDPFGHSSTQGAFLSAKVGFDALYFGRIDYQDLEIRKETKALEMIWDASPSLGSKDGSVFLGVWTSGNYGPPQGFCWEGSGWCNDDPIMDDPNMDGYNVKDVISKFYNVVMDIKEKSHNDAKNIMLQFGSDFLYSNSLTWYKNIDKLIHYMNEDGRFNVFYSTPWQFTVAKNKEHLSYSRKTDDFFPYADQAHGYWTGYFTSRVALKLYERVCSSFLQTARQIESLKVLRFSKNSTSKHTPSLRELEEAVAVVQHHDGVSGTSKQHVAYDYAYKLSKGFHGALESTLNHLGSLLGINDSNSQLQFCLLLNETTCKASENVLSSNKNMQIIIWNPLVFSRDHSLRIPVPSKKEYKVFHNNLEIPSVVEEATWSSNEKASSHVLLFRAKDLPPMGYSSFEIKQSTTTSKTSKSRTLQKSLEGNLIVAKSDLLELTFDRRTNRLVKLKRLDLNLSLQVTQEYYYYEAYEGPDDQKDGAYIFRPKTNKAIAINENKISLEIKEMPGVVVEIHQSWSHWVNQTIRLWEGSSQMEINYSVGPVPIHDGGKNVIMRFNTNVQNKQFEFWTDSNGREFQKRRLNHRPTWNLHLEEPVAGNYYPMNIAAYIKDNTKQFSIITDRTQGVSSLGKGQMEIMIQRRLRVDDSRGVDEPLNETAGGITHIDSALDSRIGDGVIIEGTHKILVDDPSKAYEQVRTVMEQSFFQPFVVFSGNVNLKNLMQPKKSMLQSLPEILPKGVSIITFKYLKENTFLIRLANQYSVDENQISQEVDLSNLIEVMAGDGYTFKHVTEMTLSGNKPLEKLNRLKWSVDDGSFVGGSFLEEKMRNTVVLKPMDIRTFVITLQ